MIWYRKGTQIFLLHGTAWNSMKQHENQIQIQKLTNEHLAQLQHSFSQDQVSTWPSYTWQMRKKERRFSCCMELHETAWNCMKQHENQIQNFMLFHAVPCWKGINHWMYPSIGFDFITCCMELHETAWNIMKLHETAWKSWMSAQWLIPFQEVESSKMKRNQSSNVSIHWMRSAETNG